MTRHATPIDWQRIAAWLDTNGLDLDWFAWDVRGAMMSNPYRRWTRHEKGILVCLCEELACDNGAIAADAIPAFLAHNAIAADSPEWERVAATMEPAPWAPGLLTHPFVRQPVARIIGDRMAKTEAGRLSGASRRGEQRSNSVQATFEQRSNSVQATFEQRPNSARTVPEQVTVTVTGTGTVTGEPTPQRAKRAARSRPVPAAGNCSDLFSDATRAEAERLAAMIRGASGKERPAAFVRQQVETIGRRIEELGLADVERAVEWWLDHGPDRWREQYEAVLNYPDSLAAKPGKMDRIERALQMGGSAPRAKAPEPEKPNFYNSAAYREEYLRKLAAEPLPPRESMAPAKKAPSKPATAAAAPAEGEEPTERKEAV